MEPQEPGALLLGGFTTTELLVYLVLAVGGLQSLLFVVYKPWCPRSVHDA